MICFIRNVGEIYSRPRLVFLELFLSFVLYSTLLYSKPRIEADRHKSRYRRLSGYYSYRSPHSRIFSIHEIPIPVHVPYTYLFIRVYVYVYVYAYAYVYAYVYVYIYLYLFIFISIATRI